MKGTVLSDEADGATAEFEQGEGENGGTPGARDEVTNNAGSVGRRSGQGNAMEGTMDRPSRPPELP